MHNFLASIFFCLFLIFPSSIYTAHFFSVLHGFGVNLTPFGIRKRIFIFPRFFSPFFSTKARGVSEYARKAGANLWNGNYQKKAAASSRRERRESWSKKKQTKQWWSQWGWFFSRISIFFYISFRWLVGLRRSWNQRRRCGGECVDAVWIYIIQM